MKIERREYILKDFFLIPFKLSPGLVSLRVADKAVYALIPALQVLATAKFIDTAIDIYNGARERGAIAFPLACLMLLIAHQYLTFALMGFVRAKTGVRLTAAFRTAVTEKRALLEYRHVENNETWDLIERVGKDPAGRLVGGLDILLRMGDIALRIGSVLAVLIAQVWWVALVIMCFSIPLLTLAVKSGKAHYESSKEAARHTRRAQYLQSALSGRDNVEERALFGYTGALNEKYRDKYQTAYKINMKAQRMRYIRIKTASLITVLVSVLISGVLIAPLGAGAISVGMFMGFVTATFGLAQSLSWELTYIAGELADHREYLRDLTAFARLSETEGAADAPARRPEEPRCIEFKCVSFKYPGTDRPVLSNLSMKLYAKKHYAFVGVNGAGKTTITKLLTGLYDNYTGDIAIDGKNLREFTQAELKAMFTIVYQDFAKYQISLADSVGIGNVNGAGSDEGASDRGVLDALEALGLTEVAERRPEGVRAPIGKIIAGGEDLSGGEWQRVAIARSLVSGAPVRILDEPTASLDPVAESAVYEMYAKISAGKSTVFITHRLGAARLADEIFVISDGCVAEQGPHEELMEKNGLYARMFEAQRGWYA